MAAHCPHSFLGFHHNLQPKATLFDYLQQYMMTPYDTSNSFSAQLSAHSRVTEEGDDATVSQVFASRGLLTFSLVCQLELCVPPYHTHPILSSSLSPHNTRPQLKDRLLAARAAICSPRLPRSRDGEQMLLIQIKTWCQSHRMKLKHVHLYHAWLWNLLHFHSSTNPLKLPQTR